MGSLKQHDLIISKFSEFPTNILPDIDSNLKAMYNRAIFSPGEDVDITSKKLETVCNRNIIIIVCHNIISWHFHVECVPTQITYKIVCNLVCKVELNNE